MTREFNQNPRYDSRPSYRGPSSNNRYGAEQPLRPTRPRLNRATVDRAWENGAPHRHADYKPRHPNEANTTQTNGGPNSQRNWRKPQPSEHSSRDHTPTPYERGDSKRPRYNDSPNQSRRSDHFSDGNQGSRSRSAQPNHSFADRPQYRDQRGNGNEENTYRARNGHPNFSHKAQEGNRGRYYQEQNQQESHQNGAYAQRTNPAGHTNNTPDYRDQRLHPYNQREAQPSYNNRFEGRQRTNTNERRYPTYPVSPEKTRGDRVNQQHEQFKGDYEQFDHAAPRQPRDDRRQEQHSPQAHSNRMGKPLEAERHVTPLQDGRVLKGSRPAQRKNAQFWTDISQDTETLVQQVQTPPEAEEKIADEPVPTNTVPVTQSAPSTRAVSSRAQAAKHAARTARKGKTDRPASSGPRPSQRGFKWPDPPSQS